jgi:hypothetical protein
MPLRVRNRQVSVRTRDIGERNFREIAGRESLTRLEHGNWIRPAGSTGIDGSIHQDKDVRSSFFLFAPHIFLSTLVIRPAALRRRSGFGRLPVFPRK